MDKERAENAVRELLFALDYDVTSEGLKDTPRRVASMYMEQCSNSDAELEVSFTQMTYDGMVIVRGIPFVSFCEHHMLPYYGRAYVGYVPRKRVLGLSKLARLVKSCCRGFSIQENVTEDIADRLHSEVELLGCMVVLNAEHGCMSHRGARALGASTITSIVRGIFRDVPAARSEFLSLIGGMKCEQH